MRQNDQIDPDHGLRGAKFAKKHRSFIDLDDDQFEKLFYACEIHTDGKTTACETVNTCWTFDRLDIGRVGFIVNSFYLSSVECQKDCGSTRLSSLAFTQSRSKKRIKGSLIFGEIMDTFQAKI